MMKYAIAGLNKNNEWEVSNNLFMSDDPEYIDRWFPERINDRYSEFVIMCWDE